MRKIATIFLTACCQFGVFSLEAAELHGKTFNDRIELHNTIFALTGLGVKSYLLVKVFVAGFYVEENSKNQDVLDDVPKRLEVAYFYKIPGAKLAFETRRRITLNTSQQEFNQIKDRVHLMNSYFVDLSPGDRYVLTYIPDQGTYFTYNERLLGKIEGKDFAKALFSVWIGKEPISQSLKQSLLGSE
jgi:Chalcone isomerase-like